MHDVIESKIMQSTRLIKLCMSLVYPNKAKSNGQANIQKGDKEKYDAKVQKKAQGLKPPRPVTTTKESLSQEVNSPTLGLQKTPKK